MWASMARCKLEHSHWSNNLYFTWCFSLLNDKTKNMYVLEDIHFAFWLACYSAGEIIFKTSSWPWCLHQFGAPSTIAQLNSTIYIRFLLYWTGVCAEIDQIWFPQPCVFFFLKEQSFIRSEWSGVEAGPGPYPCFTRNFYKLAATRSFLQSCP